MFVSNLPSVLNDLPLSLNTMLPLVTGFPFSSTTFAVNVIFSPTFPTTLGTVTFTLSFSTLNVVLAVVIFLNVAVTFLVPADIFGATMLYSPFA